MNLEPQRINPDQNSDYIYNEINYLVGLLIAVHGSRLPIEF